MTSSIKRSERDHPTHTHTRLARYVTNSRSFALSGRFKMGQCEAISNNPFEKAVMDMMANTSCLGVGTKQPRSVTAAHKRMIRNDGRGDGGDLIYIQGIKVFFQE